MFVLVLVVAGIANDPGGNDAAGERPEGDTSAVPRSVSDGGPIVDATGGKVKSTQVPRGTIVLTFDDGPDPKWTPEVLAVLKKHDVLATFFVTGANVTRYPDLVSAIHAQGSELGVHSFSHPDLGTKPRWRVDRELAETQLAVSGAAGVTTFLLRPPYSSSADAIDNLGWTTVQAAGEDGYISVFTTDDSEDWQRPGVDTIIRNATPKSNEEFGSIVLMHDAGGDRSQTVAALDQWIPLMKAKGFKFATVAGGAKGVIGEVTATPQDRFTGGVLVATLTVATRIVSGLTYLLIIVGVLVGVRLVLMVLFARRHAQRKQRPDFRWGPPVTEPVTVIVPAYNEIKNIEATVRSIVANDHPLEVLVVDDGSSDGTPEKVESLGIPNVRVLRQKNSGKPKALNAGIRAAQTDIIIMIDGDTVFEPDTVRLLAQPFADPTIGAVAGNVKIANRDELIGRMQHIEYVVGFNIDRRVQDVTGSIATVPGAGGAFRRKALLQVGGMSTDTLAEDTDLTIALGRAGWRVVFEERARAWTEAPATMAQLWKQRYRWSYGTMQAMWKHRRAVREKGLAGKVGRRGLAHVAAFHILLPLTAPLVDVFFLYGLIFADPALTLLLGAGMLGVQLLTAVYAFRLEGEPLDVLWVFPAQQIVYRQLMYSVLIRSVASALSGVAVRWQRMNRIGVLNNLLPKQPAAEPARAAVTDHTAALSLLSGNELQRRRESRSTSDTAPVAAVTGRERWLDLLKVAALTRVIAADVGAPAYVSLFPAWGVLFGIGGSMMARSAQHEPEVDVMGHRLRRVLIPLWVFGIVAVPLMLWQGWGAADDANPFFIANLVFWIFPFLDPPGSTAAATLIGGLWYVRACLWFVLLTPLMRAGLRRSPVVAMLVPLVVVGLDAWLSWGLSSSGGSGPALMDFCTYATCWMFGMAHRDGSLGRIHQVLLGVLAIAALAGGAVWTKLHVPELDIDEVPLSAALISAGAVILLLSASPLMAWLDRIPVLRELLGLLTGRALTIYLLYPIAIAATPLVAARLGIGSDARTLIFTTVGLAVVGVLAFGWVEDLAARRPLGFYPRSRKKKRKAKSFEGRASVPQVAPMPAAIAVPVSVPQRVRPLEPVLEGAGGPPRAAVHASGPLQAVGGRPNAVGTRPSFPPHMAPEPGQPDRQHASRQHASPEQSWPPAPSHRAGPAYPGPRHPGLQHSGPQPGLQQGSHPVPQRPGPQHVGPPPSGPQRSDQPAAPQHPGPQHPGPQHPGPQHPGPPDRGPQHTGLPDRGTQHPGPPDRGPQHPGPPDRGPQHPGPPDRGPQHADSAERRPQQSGAHPIPQHAGPPHPGSHPGLQQARPPHGDPQHADPQHARPQHPGPAPMPQHPGFPHSGPQAGLPYAGPDHHNPQHPGFPHSGPQAGLPYAGLDHHGPQHHGMQHPGSQQPVPGPPPRPQPPPPPPAQRSGRPR
jgi:cellulose synthase/poly-beta-1,6-N-acetylglucosamine synthase-like glycosyltransferase/peptidoglycan/xylan/chitin deacetylase (PgdA/CDA1 family)